MNDMLIKKRVCDALIQTAEPNALLRFLLRRTKADMVVGVVKRLTGGLWVGGNVYLYQDAVEFRPNGLNKLIHAGEVSWRVPLKEILSVSTGFGFVTKVITMRTERVSFRIRCYGADAFARVIAEVSSAGAAASGDKGVKDLS